MKRYPTLGSCDDKCSALMAEGGSRTFSCGPQPLLLMFLSKGPIFSHAPHPGSLFRYLPLLVWHH